ncbi:MAG: TrkH family potassium uptake protein [Methanobacterium sp.]
MHQIHRLSGREIKTILHYTGNVCLLLAVAMLIPLLISFIYNEPQFIAPFLFSTIISAVIGFSLFKIFKIEMQMTLKIAMIFSTVIWLIACALGALPYYFSGELNYLNAYFETMSGFTTTGFTMFPNLDVLSYTINFWRAFTQWIGGLGIIFLFLIILRSTGVDVMRLYLAEGMKKRMVPSRRYSSRIFVYIYLFFTVIAIFLFLLAGMPVFDSIFYTFTALPTGGFAMHNTSLLFYNSVWIEIAAMIIMIIGATNFALHYTVLKGNWKEYFKDIETKVAYSLIIITTILVTFVLYNNHVYGNDLLLNLRFALFQMVSAITTTGLQTAFYPDLLSKWIGLGTFLLTMLMIIGAGSLSTGGGIKWLRFGVLIKGIYWQVKSFMFPSSAVMPPEKIHHVTNLSITDDILRLTGAFVFTYFVIYIVSVIIVLIYYPDISRVIFEVASALSNVGLSSGIMTPDSPVVVKIIFIIDFWVGRLEIWPVLLLIAITINNIVRR